MALTLFYAGLLAAVPYLALTNQHKSWRRSLIKVTPLTLFTLSAYAADGPAFLIMAFFLSALGDVALSRPGRAAFLYGLCSFALAHFLFILLFQSFGLPSLWEVFFTNPTFAVVLLTLAMSSELWLAPFTGALRWPVRGYIVLITAMGLTALNLPAQYQLVVLGAALFILSDLMLSLVLFRIDPSDPRKKIASMVLWVLYIAGQSLILMGIAWA